METHTGRGGWENMYVYINIFVNDIVIIDMHTSTI